MPDTEKKFDPVLPYSAEQMNNFVIYDKTNYVQDRDLCLGYNKKTTGKIVKFYEAKQDEEAKVEIPTELTTSSQKKPLSKKAPIKQVIEEAAADAAGALTDEMNGQEETTN